MVNLGYTKIQNQKKLLQKTQVNDNLMKPTECQN